MRISKQIVTTAAVSRILGPFALLPSYRKIAWFFVLSPCATCSSPMAVVIPVMTAALMPAWAMVFGSCFNVSRPCSFNQVPPFDLLDEYTWSYLGVSGVAGAFFVQGNFHLLPIVIESFLFTVFRRSDSCEAG